MPEVRGPFLVLLIAHVIGQWVAVSEYVNALKEDAQPAARRPARPKAAAKKTSKTTRRKK